MLNRAQGCFLGQVAGDSLGSLVEFCDAEQISRRYPRGLRDLSDGGTWGLQAGQPTDDSEMALMLARSLVREQGFVSDKVKRSYVFWLNSSPFDVGETTRLGLEGRHNYSSQANGALMRLSPLGIWGARQSLALVAKCARADARITHPCLVCQYLSALYAMAIARAIAVPQSPAELYAQILLWIEQLSGTDTAADSSGLLADSLLELSLEPPYNRQAKTTWEVIRKETEQAAVSPVEDFVKHQGWSLLAWHNALWQLLHAKNLEEAIVTTVANGGDTDTTAAICGALLGAVYGRSAVPQRWQETILSCRLELGRPGVLRPRPQCFWPTDLLELTEQLLKVAPQT